MKQRKKLIIANWKMHTVPQAGVALVKAYCAGLQNTAVQLVVAAPFTHLAALQPVLAEHASIALGAQNCHEEVAGAFTGEVSAAMLQALGVTYVLLGHSERRKYYQETDEIVAKKVTTALIIFPI